jgi:thioredoxin reductase (NADPH)
MTVRIVDSLPELGGQLAALYPEKYVYDMPGFPKVLARDLASSLAEQGTQFGPELYLEQTAQTLERADEGWLVRTSKGAELASRTVIISAGVGAFTPTRIGIEREADFEGNGLYYGVKERAAFHGKRLVVVGGGDSAIDWCLSLEPIAKDLKLVHRRDVFRAHEDSVRQIHESGVELKLWYTVKELHGNGHLQEITVEHSQTKELERLELDALIVNVGYKSSLGPLKEWGLNIEKTQIRVNERFETNLPGVFAIGDVCGFPGKLKLIATGVGEAATAVCFAKTHIDPQAKLFPGHSSDMELK